MVVSIVILALGLVVVAVYLSKLTKTLHNDSGAKNATLEEARIKAIKIIDDANNQAVDIISKATLSTDLSAQNFKEDLATASSDQIKKFEKATSDFTNMYTKTLQDLRTKNIEVFQNISKDIETNTMDEVKNFKESMKRLTTLSQKEVKRKIEADYEAARKEIESYKKEELGKIDLKIYEFLGKVSKLVLGKAISLSEHEDLIEKSLEKAKKEGVFKELG